MKVLSNIKFGQKTNILVLLVFAFMFSLICTSEYVRGLHKRADILSRQRQNIADEMQTLRASFLRARYMERNYFLSFDKNQLSLLKHNIGLALQSTANLYSLVEEDMANGID